MGGWASLLTSTAWLCSHQERSSQTDREGKEEQHEVEPGAGSAHLGRGAGRGQAW